MRVRKYLKMLASLTLIWPLVLSTMLACTHPVLAPATPPVVKAAPVAYDADLSNYDYPYPVQHYRFQAQGLDLQMAYMDVLPEHASGRTVLLLHGKNFSGAYWAPTIAFLRDRGFRVIAPDQIGFGKSSKPKTFKFALPLLATFTHDLLVKLGVKAPVVMGHSMGGMIAMRYSLLFPNDLERLVLVSPLGLEDWRTFATARPTAELVAQELKTTPETMREYQRKNYFAGDWKPEYEKLIEIPVGWTRGPDMETIALMSALTTEMIFNQPVIAELGKIRTPTLLITGRRDRTAPGRAWATPEKAELMGRYDLLGPRAAKAMPYAQLVEFENDGHLPQVQHFDRYRNVVLDFLSNPPACPRKLEH